MPSAFTSPERLLLLVGVAGLVVVYLLLQVHRRRLARAWADPAIAASTMPDRPGLVRHLAPLLMLAALVAMTTGFAGPVDEVEVERDRATIVVALDTSASMLAEDVAPDRFTSAKRAVTDFVAALPDGFDVALVGFAGRATVLVPATDDGSEVTRALEQVELSGGTALGDALIASVTAASARPGEVPAAVVLLADGDSTTGAPTIRGIRAAEDAGIPVHTIAYGTPQGVVVLDGTTYQVPVDEAILASIAEQTGGTAYTAATADQLDQVYESIRGRLTTTTEEQDVSARFAGLGLLLLGAAAVPGVLRSRFG